MKNNEINDVTDTALWVAAYRAEEHERKDALFRDPYARLLIGDNGIDLARRTQGSRYTAWSVVIRTTIIDQFILKLISEKGINRVINLGAGLDTRPYRLVFPENFQWVEVDFDKIISFKNDILKKEIPKCNLKRISLDLSLESSREELLKTIEIQSNDKILILTEGVVPYLKNEDVASLAKWLHQQPSIHFWITEYYSPEILKFLRTPKRLKQMTKAPFLFYPEDWFEFYKNHGWSQYETKYFGIESEKLSRMPPTPGWLKEDDTYNKDKIKKFLGYSILEKN